MISLFYSTKKSRSHAYKNTMPAKMKNIKIEICMALNFGRKFLLSIEFKENCF